MATGRIGCVALWVCAGFLFAQEPPKELLVIAVDAFHAPVFDAQVGVHTSPILHFTLQMDPAPPCGPCVEPEGQHIPTERQDLNKFISFAALESPLTIRTTHDSKPEQATKAQLERLIAAHDLRQWTFTHQILIDETSIPHSHPVLTLHTRHLKQDDELLSTYLHEQLHWFLAAHEEATRAAEEDLKKLYPSVPSGYPEGAQDTQSTYLHLLVCWLEQKADRAVLGDQRTADAMQFWAGDHYRWVYRTVLSDGPKIEEVLKRHGLADPDARVGEARE